MQLSSRHRANPDAGHQCRSLSSAGTRPKLRDPPAETSHDLERCSYQSQTTGLACTNRNAYRGVTDLKCLNMFTSITSEGVASNHSPCTRTPLPPVNAQRSQAPAPMCAAQSGAHSGSTGVRSGAASSDITGQWGSVRGCGRSVSAL